MIKTIFITAMSALLMAGCTIGFGRNGNLIIAPALPVTIELDADQYYYQNGYYYHQNGNIWVYSESRQGPWLHLPRSHYPRKVHYKGHGEYNHGHDYRQHDR